MVNEAVRIGWHENRNTHYDQFIGRFKDYIGMKYCLPTSHCTSAIHLAMLALGIKENDEVIVPDVTWVASVAPICYVGAKPVFVDIDKKDWCISPKSFEAAITDKTKAIITAFALETRCGEDEARRKLKDKDVDFMVLNYANEEGSGFDSSTNRVIIFSKEGTRFEVTKDRKDRIAEKIITHILQLSKQTKTAFNS